MLRLASPTDLESVFEIYVHPDVVPFLGYDAMSLDAFCSVFKELIDCRSFYVFERNGTIAGFCRACRQTGRAQHVAYLSTFAVAPHFRGSGIARELLEEVITLLQSQGVLRVELMLEADNPRAFAFYRKLGFEQEGLMRSAYKRSSEPYYIDEIFMAKLLVDLPRRKGPA